MLRPGPGAARIPAAGLPSRSNRPNEVQAAGATSRRPALRPRSLPRASWSRQTLSCRSRSPQAGSGAACRATARSCSARASLPRTEATAGPVVQGGHELLLDRRGREPGGHGGRHRRSGPRSRAKAWGYSVGGLAVIEPPSTQVARSRRIFSRRRARRRSASSPLSCSLQLVHAPGSIRHRDFPRREPLTAGPAPVPLGPTGSSSSQRPGWLSSSCTPPGFVSTACSSPRVLAARSSAWRTPCSVRASLRAAFRAISCSRASRSRTAQPTAAAQQHQEEQRPAAAIASARLFRRANLPKPIARRRRARLHRLVGQVALHVQREAVGRLVAAVAVLLQRLHHDPVQLAAHQLGQLRRLRVPLGRDRRQRVLRLATAACSAWAAPPRG